MHDAGPSECRSYSARRLTAFTLDPSSAHALYANDPTHQPAAVQTLPLAASQHLSCRSARALGCIQRSNSRQVASSSQRPRPQDMPQAGNHSQDFSALLIEPSPGEDKPRAPLTPFEMQASSLVLVTIAKTMESSGRLLVLVRSIRCCRRGVCACPCSPPCGGGVGWRPRPGSAPHTGQCHPRRNGVSPLASLALPFACLAGILPTFRSRSRRSGHTATSHRTSKAGHRGPR